MRVATIADVSDASLARHRWSSMTLGDLLGRVSNGLVYRQSKDQQYPITRIETISDGSINMNRTGRAAPCREIEAYRLQPGDILFSHINSLEHIGKVAIYRGGSPLYHGMNLLLLRCGNALNPEYLYYWLSSSPGRRASALLARPAVSQASINTTDLKSIEIPVPPMAEQEAIAEALSDADAYVVSLERLIAKKRLVKKGAMQALLTGNRRLPGFAEDWTTERLGDVLTIAHGKNQKSVADSNGSYPILATGGQIGTANRFLWDKPSMLIGRKGTIDKPQFMDTPFWTVDTLFYSMVKDPNSAKFLFYRACLIDWKQHNEASGVPSLNARTIENIEIALPPSEEQEAIASLLTDMDAEIAELSVKLTKARDIKQGMMQQLLTGKVRLV
jgi:type I restriction enzyme, S subunit